MFFLNGFIVKIIDNFQITLLEFLVKKTNSKKHLINNNNILHIKKIQLIN